MWSAKPCPVMSRVGIPLPWAQCCPVCSWGGWDGLALPVVGLPTPGTSAHQDGMMRSPGCRQGGP